MNISDSISESIEDPKFLPALIDLAEAGIDTLLNEGLIKEVPIIGILAKTYDIGRNISNRIYLSKLSHFLISANKYSKEIKLVVGVQFDKGDRYKKAGESIIFLIDSLNDSVKASLMGLFFGAYIAGDLNDDEFEKVKYAISNLHGNEYRHLVLTPYDIQFANNRETGRLYECELFECPIEVMNENDDDEDDGKNGKKYRLSPFGTKFANIMFSKAFNYEKVNSRAFLHDLKVD